MIDTAALAAARDSLRLALAAVQDAADACATSHNPEAADRLAVYIVGRRGGERERVAECSVQALGLCLLTLRDEGQLTHTSRVGVLDRDLRRWVINPWA